MFALCMSRGHPTIQDVYNQNCINKQIKGGYLLRYRRGLFCSGWSEEWVVLYEDSTIAWYADKGLNRPRGRIRIGDSPDLLAVGEWTRKVPKRPKFPRSCHIGQLLAIGSRRPQDVQWLIAQSPAEVNDWMTAISNTLPPPPHFPLEDKTTPNKQQSLLHQQPRDSLDSSQNPISYPRSSQHKTPSTSLATASKSQNFENDHTVISGVEYGWGHGWGWGGAVWAAEAACVHEAAVSSALYCQNLEDYGVGGYEEMDWSAFVSFKLFVYEMTEMEPLGQVCRKRKERIESMVEQPPYCQKEFPCLPIIDDCLPVPLRLEVSDATRLMYFMENFNGVTSKEQEYDINTYLKKTCEASDVFIIHIIRSSDQGRVQMLTDRVLEDEIVMPLSKRTVNAIVQFDGQNYFCANELHPDVKGICTAVMDREGDPMNVIPIISRCRRNKDETLKIHGNPVALVCLLNCEKDDYFVLRATQELFRYCSTTLLNTMEGEQEKKLKHNSHLLLEATKSLFMNIHDLDLLLRDIMIKAKDLTDAEKCSLFLMDPEHLHWVSRVFNADPADGVMEVRITLDQAIAAHVAATGRVMNIRDAYQHPLFHKDDEAGGVKTRNILCFPIRDEKEIIIGVGQVFNKKTGHFDSFDEEMVESFAVNCGISFMHSLMYKKMENSVRRSIMAQNIMINKKQVTMEDVAQVLCCKSIHNLPFFDTFEFLTRSIILPETVCYLVRMFDELNYMTKFKIRDITLIKFFLTIQASYGDNAYRNWHQGFAAGHFVYCVLKQLSLVESRYISPVEGFSLLISAFCFNVDCFGSINPFLLNTKSILANFFTSESRVRSRHSLNQTLIIMNMEGCNILEGLTDQEYSICIEVIKDLIYAADISFHFKFLHKQKKICAEFYQNFNPAHRYYFCCLIMTAAVLSDFAKDWLNTKRISWFLLEEFFLYGDMEKSYHRKPVNGMDRDDVNVSELLIDFMEEVCLPVFRIFTTLMPQVQILKDHLEENIEVWRRLDEYFQEKKEARVSAMDALLSEDLVDTARDLRKKMKEEKRSRTEVFEYGTEDHMSDQASDTSQ